MPLASFAHKYIILRSFPRTSPLLRLDHTFLHPFVLQSTVHTFHSQLQAYNHTSQHNHTLCSSFVLRPSTIHSGSRKQLHPLLTYSSRPTTQKPVKLSNMVGTNKWTDEQIFMAFELRQKDGLEKWQIADMINERWPRRDATKAGVNYVLNTKKQEYQWVTRLFFDYAELIFSFQGPQKERIHPRTSPKTPCPCPSHTCRAYRSLPSCRRLPAISRIPSLLPSTCCTCCTCCRFRALP